MTSKQFYITFSIFLVSLKVQRLPSLVYEVLNHSSYLLFVGYFLVDLVAILLAFFVLKILKNKNFLKEQSSPFVKLFVKLALICIALYFVFQGTLFYESIQDLFSHILFNNLPWTLFSLLLVACVFYLAASGLVNIARNFELYFFVIIISYIMLSIFGAIHTDFSNILPFADISLKGSFKHLLDFNIWFGDFFLVLFLGLSSKEIKLKWLTLSYVLSSVYVILVVIEFNGIYLNYTDIQPSLITMISEQSMLGLEIGRVDWFLILISEIGAILSCGLCLHFAKDSLCLAFPKVKPNYFLIGIVALIYLTDVLYLVDTNAKEMLFFNFAGVFALAVKLVSFVLVLCFALFTWKRQKKKKIGEPAEEKAV